MRCPVCDTENIGEQFEITDLFLSQEIFELVKCGTCGMVYTNNPPTPAEIGKYYNSEEYLSHNDKVSGLMSFMYRGARGIMLQYKRKSVEKISGLKGGKILDIGCGTGHFLLEMRQAGWNVIGVEINDNAREQAKSFAGVEVMEPSGLNELPAKEYDVITLWHVLEHFHDPKNYMKEIRRLLKPGGTCVIALPNIDSFDALHYGGYWAAYDVPRHLSHFSPDTFQKFAVKSGFIIFKIKPLPLDVLYISILSEKQKKSLLPLCKGFFIGKWLWLRSLFNKNKTSSLIYFLRQKTEE